MRRSYIYPIAGSNYPTRHDVPLVVIERLVSDFARDNKRKSVEQKKRWLMNRVSALDKVKKVRDTSYSCGAGLTMCAYRPSARQALLDMGG